MRISDELHSSVFLVGGLSGFMSLVRISAMRVSTVLIIQSSRRSRFTGMGGL